MSDFFFFVGLKEPQSSEEVVLSDNGAEIVFRFTLNGSREALELLEAYGIMNTFFEKVKFRLADAQQSVHLEKALSRVVEGFQAHWLKCKVL